MHMAFDIIIDPEVEQIVLKLAALRGVSVEQAIRDACRRESTEIEAEQNLRRLRAREIFDELDVWPKTGPKVD